MLLALLLALAGCGRDDGGADSDPEAAADVEVLDAILVGELTTLDAYTQGLPKLKGRMAAVGRRFRAQEQEYVDALTKAIRGLGGELEAEAAEVDLSEARTQAHVLALLYELESDSLVSYVDASPRLYTSAPRTLATALAAGHAQHLTILRMGLGIGIADAAPEAFDTGEIPLPDIEPVPGRG